MFISNRPPGRPEGSPSPKVGPAQDASLSSSDENQRELESYVVTDGLAQNLGLFEHTERTMQRPVPPKSSPLTPGEKRIVPKVYETELQSKVRFTNGVELTGSDEGVRVDLPGREGYFLHDADLLVPRHSDSPIDVESISKLGGNQLGEMVSRSALVLEYKGDLQVIAPGGSSVYFSNDKFVSLSPSRRFKDHVVVNNNGTAYGIDYDKKITGSPEPAPFFEDGPFIRRTRPAIAVPKTVKAELQDAGSVRTTFGLNQIDIQPLIPYEFLVAPAH